MDIVWQILIGLATIFIGFLIGSAWQAAKRSRAYWQSHRFWKPLLSGDVVIVADKFGQDTPELRGWEASGLVGGGGMQAALEVVELLEDFRLLRVGRKASIVYHNESGKVDDALKSNLFCIGGPDANRVTAKILNHIGYKIPENRGFSPHLRPGRIYDPTSGTDVSDDKGDALDYGRLIRVQNPYRKGRCVFILWGNSGYGTWAAAKLLRSQQLRDSASVKQGLDVDFQFQTEVSGQVAQEPVVTRVTELSPNVPDLAVLGPP
ncbi:MAG TPA: hypothetical protein VGG75_19665 [Trebonia sp.]|jgi:hypothetical protein